MALHIFLVFVAMCCCPGVAVREQHEVDVGDLGMQDILTNESNLISNTPWKDFLTYGKFMGSGAFGSASLYNFKAPCEGTVVVKEIREGAHCVQILLVNELNILKDLRGHPNVLHMYDYFPHDSSQWCTAVPLQIMTEVAYGGELDSAFLHQTGGWNARIKGWFSASAKKERRELKKKLILMIARDILNGLDFVHTKGYIHRDIKPANIWSASENVSCIESMSCRYILGDFGVSGMPTKKVKLPDGTIELVSPITSGTFSYMAPEQISESGTVYKSDIYSIALTLAGIMSWPWEPGLDEPRRILEIATKKEYYPKDFGNLLTKMMAPNFWDRPSAAEARETVKAIIGASYPEIRQPSTTQELLQEPPCVAACREAQKVDSACDPDSLGAFMKK